VAGFKARGLAERDIAVLYPRRERDRIDALCRVLRETCAVSWVSNEADPDGGVRSLTGPGVRLMTVHAAKGLEFPAVVVSAVDQLPSPMGPDEVRDGDLLYGGLTRATDHPGPPQRRHRPGAQVEQGRAAPRPGARRTVEARRGLRPAVTAGRIAAAGPGRARLLGWAPACPPAHPVPRAATDSPG
jgi:hypothetical protein